MLYYFEFKWVVCYRYSNSCDTRDSHNYYYVFGVDNDNKVFVNRVTGAPDFESIKVSDNSDNIELRYINDNDNVIRGVMGYNIDLGDLEDVTIDVDIEKMNVTGVNVRVQGDIVLRVEPFSETRLLGYIGYDSIVSHVRLLLIDIINRILLDYGLSAAVRANAVVLESVAPRRNDNVYRRKVFKLLAKELKEFLGENNVYVNENIEEIRITGGDFGGFGVDIGIGGGGRDNPYNHIIISIRRSSRDLEDNEFCKKLLKELLEALENLPPLNHEFSIGNHYIKIYNAKPLSFTFRPSRQPIGLNENIINIVNPLTYIVTPNSTIELYHREHGLKVVRFKNNYIITFSDTDTHRNYNSERNRVILRNLEL
jgi:hypothetical protein